MSFRPEKYALESGFETEFREEFLSWLAGDPKHGIRFAKLSRIDFSNFFLEFLKNQTRRFLEDSEVKNDNASGTHNSLLEEDFPIKNKKDDEEFVDTLSPVATTPKRYSKTVLPSPVTPVGVVSCDYDHSNFSYSTPVAHKSKEIDSNYSNRSNISGGSNSVERDLSHGSGKKAGHARTNLCIGDFIMNKSEITPINKKKKSAKFLTLSMNDPLLNSNKENMRSPLDPRGDKYSNFNINDKEMFPDIGTKKVVHTSKVNIARRIKPTRLNMTYPCPDTDSDRTTGPFQRSDVKFGEKYDKIQQNDAFIVRTNQSGDFKTERDILKTEKDSLLEKFNGLNVSKTKKLNPACVSALKSEPLKNRILFDFSNLRNRDHLVYLAQVFALLLDSDLIINPTAEMHYLFSLAILQRDQVLNKSDGTDENSSFLKDKNECVIFDNLLDNSSNCVFFALCTMEMQNEMLRVILDRNCLKIFIQNERIESFFPRLVNIMTDFYNSILNTESKSNNSESALYKTVCFITETDSADNFSTRQNFISFKSQRDSFYEILRIWEEYHLSAGWKFEIALGPKVRSLISTNNNPTNIAHLARLFRDQLLIMCTKQNDPAETIVHLQAVIGGNGLNANRINKLTERLTGVLPSQCNKTDRNDLCNPPDFSSSEEFFRDFITHSANTTFREHLINAFVQEIHRLDNINILTPEKDESNYAIDADTKNQFLICIRSLRVLAKFLGYLISLPYLNASISPSVNQKVVDCEIALRDQTLPPINMIIFVEKAKHSGKLVLTIPWIVELLVMLDYSSLRLSYFKDLLEILFEMYVSYSCKCRVAVMNTEKSSNNLGGISNGLIFDVDKVKISHKNFSLIKLCLGWLFNMQHFPHDFLHGWILKREFELGVLKSSPPSGQNSLFDHTNDSEKNVRNDKDYSVTTHTVKPFEERQEYNWDMIDVIDESIVKEICPFLQETRSLILRSQIASENKTKNVRHITPVTSSTQANIKNNDLQLRLEEWFLRSQPGTTKRILELVSDRIGAALVRLVKAQFLDFSASVNEEASLLMNNIRKENQMQEIRRFYQSKLIEFHKGCKRAGHHIGTKRVVSALQGLLPSGVTKAVLDVCTQICTRNAARKLTHCLQTQFNSIKAFTDTADSEIKKNISFCAETANESSQYDLKGDKRSISFSFDDDKKADTSPKTQIININPLVTHNSPTLVLIDLKEFLIDLTNSKHAEDYVYHKNLELLNRIKGCIVYSYVDKYIKDTLLQMSLDTTIFMISMFPNSLNNDYLNLAKDVWINSSSEESCSNDVKSTRNIESEQFRKLMLDSSDECCPNNEKNETGPLDNGICDIKNSREVKFLNNVVCSKNLMIVGSYSTNCSETWSAFARFLIFLLKNNLMDGESFAEQCIAIYRNDWPQSVHKGFAKCIKEVLDGCDIKSKSKLNMMLDFLSEYCEDINQFHY